MLVESDSHCFWGSNWIALFDVYVLYCHCMWSPTEVVSLSPAKVDIPNPVRNGGIVMNTHTVPNIVVRFLEHQVSQFEQMAKLCVDMVIYFAKGARHLLSPVICGSSYHLALSTRGCMGMCKCESRWFSFHVTTRFSVFTLFAWSGTVSSCNSFSSYNTETRGYRIQFCYRSCIQTYVMSWFFVWVCTFS